ncbi:MAG: hypothetical protein Q8M22_13100 [Actinomycetota bacterium]|nr:hypothetical protein [Actinomycetota bacterium]
METTRPHPVEQLPAGRPAAADAFLDTLRAEQSRFLEAIARARSLLGHESGQLANVAAVHGRLTRQFFDAQRTIMSRRAELDAEVAAVGGAAEERAAAQLAMARERVAAGSVGDDVAESGEMDDPARTAAMTGRERSTRQQIAALGVSVVRTMDDVDALATVINGAFELDEADGVAAQRQLTVLLDDWWQAELQEGRAVIDDAHARAAVRQHLAGIEAGQLIEAARASAGRDDVVACGDERSAVLPRDVVEVFDDAPDGDLESLLAHLTDSLQLPADVTLQAATDDSDVIIRFEPAPMAPAAAGSAEAFQHFWSQEPRPPVARGSAGWLPSHVLVPMTAATSLLALLFAWIG